MKIFITALLALNVFAFANESPPPAAEGASGGSANEADLKSQNEYIKKESELRSLDGKIKENKKKVEELIHSKNVTGDSNKKVALVEEIKAAHIEYLKNVREYNTKMDELKYRYPDKGRLIEARFIPLQEKGIEEIEQESGLDARLTQAKKVFDSQYRDFKAPPEEKKIIKSKKKKSEPAEPEKVEKLKLSK